MGGRLPSMSGMEWSYSPCEGGIPLGVSKTNWWLFNTNFMLEGMGWEGVSKYWMEWKYATLTKWPFLRSFSIGCELIIYRDPVLNTLRV